LPTTGPGTLASEGFLSVREAHLFNIVMEAQARTSSISFFERRDVHGKSTTAVDAADILSRNPPAGEF